MLLRTSFNFPQVVNHSHPPGETCSTLMQLLRRHMLQLLFWHCEALWANRPVCCPDAHRKGFAFVEVCVCVRDQTKAA